MNRPPQVRLRRVAPSGDPFDQAEILGWLQSRPLPGMLPVREVAVTGDTVEVSEERRPGFTLGEALDGARAHVGTAVALSFVGDAALALARLHALDRERPPIHGSLSLDDLIVTTDADLFVAGFEGRRGRPADDVRALVEALRALLRPKAEQPGGAALLERLGNLRFDSAADLHQTIGSYLHKQSPEKLTRARQRFVEAVVAALGGAPFRPRSNSSIEALAAGRSGVFAAHLAQARLEEELDGSLVDTDETEIQIHAELQAALDGAFTGPATTLDEEPFIDADATEALSGEPMAAPWGPTGDLTPEDDGGGPTSILDVDPGVLAGATDALSSSDAVAGPGAPSPFGPSAEEALTGGSAAAAAATEIRIGEPLLPGSTRSPDPGEAPPAEAAGLLAPAAAPEEKSQAVRVGNYRVVAAIGKGGMGEIYLARDLESDRLVALKVLAAVDEGDDEALSMLMDEAAIMAQIEHPHVLKVVDFGRSEDRYFLASEYLEGRPLVRVMIESHDREGGLDPAVVACIGAQAARGLHAAHTATSARGTPLEVVHRDVSPQNIFLTYAGEAKVIDFGVARASERVSSTQVGLVKGKAAYMSPEQAEGKELDARSDVFSLGVCLWEMVAGKRLFKQALDYETLVAVQTAQVEPPSPVRGEKPNALDDIILASLERDPSRRTSSADALAAALEGYAHSRGVTDPLGLLAGTMKRLFQEEADRERALMEQLAARSATDEEEASLRHLSGVSQQGPVKSITFVGEPDGLGALDDYGEREPQTGERVLQKVLKLDAERRSGEHPSPWGTGPQPRVVLPPALPRTPRAERHRRSRWPWLAGAGVLALAGSLLFALRGARETAPALSVREVGREALAAPLAAAGARLSPPTGRLQRIEGLPTGPLMLDEGARIARVEGAARAGWLLELTPIDGGPAVAWLESGEPGSVRATALSVNDCPATAQVRAFEGDVELRYGSTRTRVPLGGDGLSDVSVNAPAGADQLTLEPLGLGFGRERAPAGAVICPTAWETADRVVLRRLPPGRYVLAWSGPGVSERRDLVVR